MQNGKLNHQNSTEIAAPPFKGLMIMTGSVLAIIAAVAIPFFGESLLAVLLYGKSFKKAFKQNS